MPDQLKFRTPTRCRNGHFRWYYWEASFGEARNQHWGLRKLPECVCHTGGFGQGFEKCGDDQIFINLKDTKGNLIYEGDIVHAPTHRPAFYAVAFTENAFCATHPDLDGYPINLLHFYPSPGCQITVVGNTYETPELIKNSEYNFSRYRRRDHERPHRLV